MTTDEAVAMLQPGHEELKGCDGDGIHRWADYVLLEFLETNGHPEVAAAWNALDKYFGGFWYS